MEPILVISYNLRGFNQGFTVLKDVVQTSDILFIQEHWLSSDRLCKLDISSDFLCFSKSAMDSAVGTGILGGRPFGGLAVYIHTRLQHDVELIRAAERVIIVKCCNVLVANLYLLCYAI